MLVLSVHKVTGIQVITLFFFMSLQETRHAHIRILSLRNVIFIQEQCWRATCEEIVPGDVRRRVI